jgi:hypothetical protein
LKIALDGLIKELIHWAPDDLAEVLQGYAFFLLNS